MRQQGRGFQARLVRRARHDPDLDTMERILEINKLEVLTQEVVEAAWESLVIDRA